MAETVHRGPNISLGSVLDGRVETLDGPDLNYQSAGFPDVRFFGANTTGLATGRVRAMLSSPLAIFADNVPQASSAIGLAAAGTAFSPTAGVPLPINTPATVQPNGPAAVVGAPSIATNVAIYNALTGALVTGLTALDFGFATIPAPAASKTQTASDGTLFYPGQWICIPGGANAAKTAPLYTQVTAVAGNVITLRDAMIGLPTNVPVGNAVPPVPPGAASAGIFPVAVQPFAPAGLGLYLNPAEALSRGISITPTGVTGTVTVRGFDVYGFPMSVVFTGLASTLAYAIRAMKYVATVANTTTAGTFSLGWGDLFGFALRADRWEWMDMLYNGATVTTSAGFTAADKTGPATPSSGDVRGTVQVSAAGPGGTPIAGAAATGSARLFMGMSPGIWNMLSGTPINAAQMYGASQYAA